MTVAAITGNTSPKEIVAMKEKMDNSSSIRAHFMKFQICVWSPDSCRLTRWASSRNTLVGRHSVQTAVFCTDPVTLFKQKHYPGLSLHPMTIRSQVPVR